MWMMDYNNGSDFNFPSPDHHHHHHHYSSFHGSRRLRPLIPRPLPNPPPLVNRLHDADFFPLNHHFPSMGGGDHNKRDSFQAQAQPVVVSSRWNPTPEQLRALEELYRRGTRTPSADQIQHITAQLRRYGKIEGKNVFYWFQNHKARERQKRRRQMESDDDHSNINNEVLEKKDSSSSTPGGANRTLYVETTKNWTPPTKCCSEAQAEAGLVQTEAAAVAQTRAGGWPSLAEEELQPTRERNATWQPVQLSSPPSSSPYCAAAKVTAAPPSPTTTTACNIIRGEEEGITGVRDVCQTLQLFPLGGGGCRDDSEEAGISSAAGMNISHSTYQFFEFLPVKN